MKLKWNFQMGGGGRGSQKKALMLEGGGGGLGILWNSLGIIYKE